MVYESRLVDETFVSETSKDLSDYFYFSNKYQQRFNRIESAVPTQKVN